MPRDRFFLFDLDGTLTRVELLPLIGRTLDLEEPMAQLTRQAMAGEVPFEESFRHRVDLLKSIPIAKVAETCGAVPLHEELVAFARKHADHSAIVTGNLDVWIGGLAKRIGLPVHCSVAAVDGGFVHGIERIIRKQDVIAALPDHEVVVVGDGHNDAELMERAPIAIAFGGVHAPASSLLAVCSHAAYDERTLCRLLEQLS